MSALGLSLYLTGCGMRLEISSDDISLSVYSMGCIYPSLLSFIARVYKHYRIASLCRGNCLVHDVRIVLCKRIMEILF